MSEVQTTSRERGRSYTQAFVRHVPSAAGLLVLGLSGVVLLGWATGNRTLQSFLPGFVTMKANTAFGLGVAASALLLIARQPAQSDARPRAALALASVVVALGLGTLAQYVFGIDLGIDQLIFAASDEAHLTATPGRMAATTATAFVMLGGSLFAAGRGHEHNRSAQFLAICVGALGLTALLGYVYGAIPTEELGQGIQIAPHAAAGLVLLATGILAHRCGDVCISTLLSERAGGILARRLLPLAFLVPLCLGVMRLLGSRFGVYDTATGSAMVAVATMISFGFLIWRAARALNESDSQWRAGEESRLALMLSEQSARIRADAEGAARATADQAREAAERAAREKADALALLDLVLDSTPIGLALLGPDLRYQRVNPALAAINGAAIGLHIGHTMHDVAPHQVHLEAVLRSVLATGRPVVNIAQTVEVAGTGRAQHSLASVYPVRSDDGTIVGVGVTVVDTTDRRQLEEQLLHSQKMEAVGLLAGGIAHDFNNMLTAVISYSDLLLEDLDAGDRRRDDVKEIGKAAHRAAALTRQLLAFSRRQVLQPRVLDLNGSVIEIEKMLGRLIGADINLATRLDPDIGHVKADPGQIEQVIMNLVVNARDAMPDGGDLVIETANVELDDSYEESHAFTGAGPHVMLSVTDTGCGMTPEVRDRIFEPFFTTKESGKGTGLGLATVYGIVRQSGGHLWVYSEVGKGTTFRCYLPRVDEPTDAPVATEPAVASRRGSETVLLVEDDEAVRSVVGRILRKTGYHVLEATTGEEALATCANNSVTVDLLVIDMVMPGMSGLELGQRVREQWPAVPMVFMSGYTEELVTRRRLLAPGSVFIEKPFTPDVLARTLRQVLDAPVVPVPMSQLREKTSLPAP